MFDLTKSEKMVTLEDGYMNEVHVWTGSNKFLQNYTLENNIVNLPYRPFKKHFQTKPKQFEIMLFKVTLLCHKHAPSSYKLVVGLNYNE